MDSTKLKENLSPERQASQPQKGPDRPHSDSDVKRAASELVQNVNGTENAETQDGVEMGSGNVSEDASEDKNKAAQGGGKKAYSTDEVEAIRAKLLAALPPQEVMIKEIKKKLYKQEDDLSKRMKKLSKHSHTQSYQLTIVISQLRKIREYFSMLAHATFDIVKHLWLKIVHGV